MSGVRERRLRASPPSGLFPAALALFARGARALNAIPSARNSSAMPRVTIDIPYLLIVYGRCGANQSARIFSGGDSVTRCAFELRRKSGTQARETRKVPRILICWIRSKRLTSISSDEDKLIADALFTQMSIPPK